MLHNKRTDSQQDSSRLTTNILAQQMLHKERTDSQQDSSRLTTNILTQQIFFFFFFWWTGETALLFSVLLYFSYSTYSISQQILPSSGSPVSTWSSCGLLITTSLAEIWTHNPDNLSTSDGYMCSRSQDVHRPRSAMAISINPAC